jgi:predicted Rossmann fold nucleotide-binding protein DprA/Smf involved in DNA uptake
MVSRIISGGQTGVDQAALDAAIASGVSHGGWLPAGRRTENGPLSRRYEMQEMPSPSYPQRTRKNIVEADATLIISRGQLTGGSALTAAIAAEVKKPYLHIDLQRQDHGSAAVLIKRWLHDCDVDVLNVAGPRASSDECVYSDAYCLVVEVLKV